MLKPRDPWPVDRCHTAPSVPPPARATIAASLVRTGMTATQELKLTPWRPDTNA